MKSLRRCMMFVVFLLSISIPAGTSFNIHNMVGRGGDWLDYFVGGYGVGDASSSHTTSTLSLAEVSTMRVRDLKFRLTRQHGYSATEVGKILDKKELIQVLAFEEHKIREKKRADIKRTIIKQMILYTMVAIAVVMCWPLLYHAYEVVAVNSVVYVDRKKFELLRCYELQSLPGLVGIMAMVLFDSLSAWLSLSILASWICTRNHYFFPTPSIPIQPGQFMGTEVANGPLGSYGFNVGPMVISWSLRLIRSKIEQLTGKCFAYAQKKQKEQYKERIRKRRETETPEEKKRRREARRVAKQKEAEEKEAASAQARARAQEHNHHHMHHGDSNEENNGGGGGETPFRHPNDDTCCQSNKNTSAGNTASYESKWVNDVLKFNKENKKQSESQNVGPSTLDELD